MIGKALRVGQRLERPEETQLVGGERLEQGVEEEPAEQPRQHPDRQEEPGATGHPAGAVEGEAPAGHDAMQMRMVPQRLAPGMEHGEEADLGPEMPGIDGDGP